MARTKKTETAQAAAAVLSAASAPTVETTVASVIKDHATAPAAAPTPSLPNPAPAPVVEVSKRPLFGKAFVPTEGAQKEAYDALKPLAADIVKAHKAAANAVERAESKAAAIRAVIAEQGYTPEALESFRVNFASTLNFMLGIDTAKRSGAKGIPLEDDDSRLLGQVTIEVCGLTKDNFGAKSDAAKRKKLTRAAYKLLSAIAPPPKAKASVEDWSLAVGRGLATRFPTYSPAKGSINVAALGELLGDMQVAQAIVWACGEVCAVRTSEAEALKKKNQREAEKKGKQVKADLASVS